MSIPMSMYMSVSVIVNIPSLTSYIYLSILISLLIDTSFFIYETLHMPVQADSAGNVLRGSSRICMWVMHGDDSVHSLGMHNHGFMQQHVDYPLG